MRKNSIYKFTFQNDQGQTVTLTGDFLEAEVHACDLLCADRVDLIGIEAEIELEFGEVQR